MGICRWHQCLLLLLILLLQQPTTWSSPTDSTLVPRSTGTGQTIFIVDSGYIAAPPLNQTQQSFTTNANQKCPPGYTPYATLVYSKVLHSSSLEVISGFGACVNGLTVNPTNYTVAYLVVKRRTNYGIVNNPNLFQSTNNAIWVPFTLGQYVILGNTNMIERTSPQGFKWFIYCYPTSIPTPLDQINSSGPNGPFNNGCSGAVGSNPYQ